MRACRPLLGTYVDIRVDHPDAGLAAAAVDAGFAAISRVQRLMSVFDPDSDLGRINRLAHRAPVAVDPWTREVLVLALDVHEASGGLFDCGAAPQPVERGRLPATGAAPVGSTLANLNFTSDGRVACSAPTRLDLGGIAKGFAVHRAAAAHLRARGRGRGGAPGGDLRNFRGAR